MRGAYTRTRRLRRRHGALMRRLWNDKNWLRRKGKKIIAAAESRRSLPRLWHLKDMKCRCGCDRVTNRDRCGKPNIWIKGHGPHLRNTAPGLARILELGKIRVSKNQLRLFKRLCRLGLRGVRLEYPTPPYTLDIAIPKKKLAIEVDSSYWHDKKSDRRKDNFLRKLGWKIIRVDYTKVDQLDLRRIL